MRLAPEILSRDCGHCKRVDSGHVTTSVQSTGSYTTADLVIEPNLANMKHTIYYYPIWASSGQLDLTESGFCPFCSVPNFNKIGQCEVKLFHTFFPHVFFRGEIGWQWVPSVRSRDRRGPTDARANAVRVFGTFSSGASDDRRGRTGTAVWIKSFKYAGVEEDIVLNVSAAILYVTRCLTGSQWSDLRSGLASVRPLMTHLYTVKPGPPGAMQLRTRGRQFELPAVKYEFNKQNFIVRSLFNYV